MWVGKFCLNVISANIIKQGVNSELLINLHHYFIYQMLFFYLLFSVQSKNQTVSSLSDLWTFQPFFLKKERKKEGRKEGKKERKKERKKLITDNCQ